MSQSTPNIVTRIAPSPTGNLHVGTARAALFNYLYARQNGGKFILRIEDTDTERSTKEFEENIIEGLKWLGLEWDNETIYRQSERSDLYTSHLQKMIDAGHAYISKESGGDRDEVIRFKNPNKEISFIDEIRGDITFDTTELGDFVIAKSLTEPLYHLAVVVDDFDMGITHVIRGEDGISNTPRQILIQQAISAPQPVYAHLPLVLATDRSKLSKRNGATSVSEFQDRGILPEAMINFLAFLGWNPGTEKELFTLEELIKEFDISKIQKGGAIFNEEKLLWYNKEYLRKLPEETITSAVATALESFGPSDEQVSKISKIVLEKISTLKEITDMREAGEFDYYFNEPELELEKLLFKGKGELSQTQEYLEHIHETYSAISDSDWNEEKLKEAIWDFASEKGRGDVLWPLRYLLTGKDMSPPPFSVADILGKEKTLSRLHDTIEAIRESSK